MRDEPNGICPPLPNPIPDPEPIGPIPIGPEPWPPELPRKYIPYEPKPQIPPKEALTPITIRALRHGCYMIRYTRTGSGLSLYHYDGTLRVEKGFLKTTASGDLYLHQIYRVGKAQRQLWSFPGLFRIFEKNPPDGIPIFPIGKYRYYLRVTQILPRFTLSSFVLGFEMWSFDHATETWTNDGAYTARMSWTEAPSGYPSKSDYLTGDVKDATGAVVGTLTMGWVSEFLRRAVVEIDRVAASETPSDNGAGVDWKSVYNKSGWDLTVDVSDTNVTEPSGASWNGAELHQRMLAWRDSANLDTEWRYHLLCVQELDNDALGWMYDHGGTDSNNITREAAAVASHEVFGDTARCCDMRNERLGAHAGPYFRTSIHEIGHAMGLYHNTQDNGIMAQTSDIIDNAVATGGCFPHNILYRHHTDDRRRLRHMPDIWVRPGGIQWGTAYSTAPLDSIITLDELELDVTMQLEAVPLGAPVRVNLKLENKADVPVTVPERLSMKRGFVSGRVIDPSGTSRSFATIIHELRPDPFKSLEPGDSIEDSLTLLRGRKGALFPMPGMYKVVVDVTWSIAGHLLRVSGDAHVIVSPTVDDEHASAALKALTTPDTLLTLVIGGDHLEEGIAAIKAALGSRILRPHFAYIEAKRLSKQFGKRQADFKSAADLLDKSTVMSPAELKKARLIMEQAGGKLPEEKE